MHGGLTQLESILVGCEFPSPYAVVGVLLWLRHLDGQTFEHYFIDNYLKIIKSNI